MQVLLVSVFVVAVAFGTWFFNYGLSLIRDQSSDTDLETQVPDALQDAPQEKRPQVVGAAQVGRLTALSTPPSRRLPSPALGWTSHAMASTASRPALTRFARLATRNPPARPRRVPLWWHPTR